MPFVGYKGFTLVELMITITLVALFLTLAMPSFQDFILNNRLSTQANDILADLALARSEAIRRAANVTICKSANPTAASPSCDTNRSSSWTNGWVVFVDRGTLGTIELSGTAPDEILRARTGVSPNSLLGDSSPGDPVRVTFSPSGLTQNLGPGETQLRLCDSRGSAYGRAIVINQAGRVRITPAGQGKAGALSCS